MLVLDKEDGSWYTDKVSSTDNSFEGFLTQVGKTYLGKTITEGEYKNIIKTIIDNLNINSKDNILDLGCGNGLMTNDIAKNAKHVTGFDLNEDLLAVALENHLSTNIDYILSDIVDIDFRQFRAVKFYMCEVIQSLEHKTFRALLQKMSSQKESFIFFVAGIPDQEKIFKFYHTPKRKDFLFKELIENKKVHLGYWWYKEHIIQICEDLGLEIEIKDQDPLLHTSHYRFDAVIEKY